MEQAGKRRWHSAVKKRKLNYRFHNPNPEADTAEYILRVFVEANMGKAEQVIRSAVRQAQDDRKMEKTQTK